MAGVTTYASNTLLTGGASSYLSNSGILSNTGAAAFFQNTSNTGTLGVAGLATFGNTSNTGTLGVAGLATFGNTSNTGTLGVAGLATFSNTSNTGTLGVAGLTTANTIAINQASVGSGFYLDANGPTRGSIYYSTMTTGGTTTIITNYNFGVYYNITTSGTYTIQVETTQYSSNVGKFYMFRNNTGSDLSVTLTNATGITSPLTISAATSASIVIASASSYALF